jgi:hypothetical protein
MLTASSVSSLLPCLLALSLGSSLVGPVLTSHLSLLAPPGKNAEYLSFSGTFESLAWVSAVRVESTALYQPLLKIHPYFGSRCARTT